MVATGNTAKIGTSLDSTGLFFPSMFNVPLVLVANLSLDFLSPFCALQSQLSIAIF